MTSRPLTLVVAPAGSGKTQFLAHWAGHAAVPTTWLSLEEVDDDPVELWTGVIAALGVLVPRCGKAARELLVRGAPAPDVVRALLAGLERSAAPASVLVIDDIHHVATPAASASLAVFVEHLPPWLHVVLAGRVDPVLALDRMRGRGQLGEIRFAELLLTGPEATEMLARLAPNLAEAEIEASVRSTDGWAAGVQLIGLAARSTPTRPGSISRPGEVHPLIEDYVWHEVLAAGDRDVVEVLEQVAVVDRVSCRLARAITGRADACELLRRGEAQGLFVYRVGPEGWFRIHPLVRAALLSRLAGADRHQEHHARAARWFEDDGETTAALEQWLLAGRPRDALRLLGERSTELYDQGREGVITRTIGAIPRDVASNDVAALIDFAVSRILGPLPAFVAAVRDAAWHAERADGDYSPSVHALQAIAFTASGDWTNGGVMARRAITELAGTWWSDPAGRFAWNMAARAVALAECWDDDDPFVRDATTAMSRDPRRGISLEGVRALGHALAGRPIEAIRVAAGIRPAAASMSILRVELDLAEAVARLEIGDRARALASLRAIADDATDPRLYAPVGARVALVQAAVDDDDTATAVWELAAAEALLAEAHGGPDLAGWASTAATVVAIRGGDPHEARRRAAAIADAFWGPVSRARVHLACGDVAAATGEVGAAQARSVRQRVIHGLLRARVATGPDAALDEVTDAVGLASEHGLLQTVVADGRQLMDVIERAAWRVPDEWLHRLRLAMAPAGTFVGPPTRDFPEPLTDRECEVLRLLPSRLTLSEIAKELYISQNTVKFHLRVVYRKLGVNSREEAAAIARSLTAAR